MNLQLVGPRIKAARIKKGFTQESLAEIVDISPMHMSVIERGIKCPRLDTFVKLANALDISADELLQDVVNGSTGAKEARLTQQILSLTPEDRETIVRIIEVLLHRFDLQN